MRILQIILALTILSLACDKSDSKPKNTNIQNPVANVSNQTESDNAVQKFEKIVKALQLNQTITPRNRMGQGSAGKFVTNNIKSSYDIQKSDSLVTEYIGTYNTENYVVYPGDADMQYIDKDQYVFGYDKSSKQWMFRLTTGERIRQKDLYAFNQLAIKAGDTKYDKYEGLQQLSPTYRQAIIQALNAQNK